MYFHIYLYADFILPLAASDICSFHLLQIPLVVLPTYCLLFILFVIQYIQIMIVI